jgi:hypothetical protein
MGVYSSSGKNAKEFADLKDKIGPQTLEKITKVYRSHFLFRTNRTQEYGTDEYGNNIFKRDDVDQRDNNITVHGGVNRARKFFLVMDGHLMGLVEGAAIKYQGLFSHLNATPFLMDDSKLGTIFHILEVSHDDEDTCRPFSHIYRYLYAEYFYNGLAPHDHIKITDIRELLITYKYADMEYMMYIVFYIFRHLIILRRNAEKDSKLSDDQVNFTNREVSNVVLSDKLKNFNSIEEFENDCKSAPISDIVKEISIQCCRAAKQLIGTQSFSSIRSENIYRYMHSIAIRNDILKNIQNTPPDTIVGHRMPCAENFSRLAGVMDIVTLAVAVKILDKNVNADIFFTAGNGHFPVLADTLDLNSHIIANSLSEYATDDTVFITPYKLFAVYYRMSFAEFLDDYPALKQLGSVSEIIKKYVSIFIGAVAANRDKFANVNYIDSTNEFIEECGRRNIKLENNFSFQFFRVRTIIYARYAYDLFAPYLYHDKIEEKSGQIIFKSSNNTEITIGTKKTEEEKQKADVEKSAAEKKQTEFQENCRKMLDELNKINKDKSTLFANYETKIPELKTLLGSEFKEGADNGIFMFNKRALQNLVATFTVSGGGPFDTPPNPKMQLIDRYLRDYNFSFKNVHEYPTGVDINAVRAKLKDQLANINELTHEADAFSQAHELKLLYQAYVEYMAEENKEKFINESLTNRPAFINTASRAMQIAGGNLNIKYIIMIIAALIIIGLIVIIATFSEEKNKPPRQYDCSFLDAFVP